MKQNKYFSPGRFVRLLRNDWLINKRTYLFTPIAIGIAIYALMFFSMITTKHVTIGQYTFFFFCYLLMVGAVISTAFPGLHSQVTTCNYLITPGSTLEKYLVQFMIRIVIFLPVALLIFWVSAHLAKASSMVVDPGIGIDPEIYIADFQYGNLFRLLYHRDVLPTILSIVSYATLLFAGSVSFTRVASVKTMFLIIFIAMTMLIWFLMLSYVFFPVETHGIKVALPSYVIGDIDNFKVFLYCWGGLSWIFFLPLAYFKLKEKEA